MFVFRGSIRERTGCEVFTGGHWLARALFYLEAGAVAKVYEQGVIARRTCRADLECGFFSRVVGYYSMEMDYARGMTRKFFRGCSGPDSDWGLHHYGRGKVGFRHRRTENNYSVTKYFRTYRSARMYTTIPDISINQTPK